MRDDPSAHVVQIKEQSCAVPVCAQRNPCLGFVSPSHTSPAPKQLRIELHTPFPQNTPCGVMFYCSSSKESPACSGLAGQQCFDLFRGSFYGFFLKENTSA